MSKVYSLPTRAADGSAAVPGIAAVEEILSELRAGRMVLVLDDEDRENEGDLIMAAECVTAAAVAFMIRHTSGIICVSTADRAATIRALVDKTSAAQDFARPGHIFPLRPRRGGVLIRAGHTEAAMDLCMLAGLQPAGVLCELMNDDGSMARRAQIEIFAREHGLKIGTIADLIRYRLRNERSVERISEQSVQTEFGEFRLVAYADRVHHDVHLALVCGRLDQPLAPLVRVHVADTLRDLLGIRGEARSWTLRAALERVAESGNGIVIILREPEGPDELAAALLFLGASASTPPSAPATDKQQRGGAARAVLRTYGIGAQILKDLGVRRMRVLSAPKQMHGISAFDLEVEGYLGEEA